MEPSNRDSGISTGKEQSGKTSLPGFSVFGSQTEGTTPYPHQQQRPQPQQENLRDYQQAHQNQRGDIVAIKDSDAPRKRRQRLSLVCRYCKKRKTKCDKQKPACGNCAKLGLKCEYTPVQWVNKQVDNKGNVGSIISTGDDLSSKSKEELIEMVKSLLSSIKKTERPLTTPVATSDVIHPQENPNEYTGDDIVLDFFEGYSSLSLKVSSHEDYKPLSPITTFKKDHYAAFFTCYLFLILSLSAEYINDLMRDTWKSKHPDGASKWMLLLDTKNDDRDLREPIKRIISDRVTLYRPSFFAFLTLSDTNSEELGLLSERFLALAPDRSISDRYLTYFFCYIWPIRPFIDENVFMTNFRRVVQYDQVTGKPSLKFLQRGDASTIAQYLVILRYASVSIQLMNYQGTSDLINPLISSPIPVDAIPTAQLFLGVYKITRKMTIESFQALLYLRFYYRDCPEETDSLSLAQSQNLMGFLTQAAYQLGLNRDPIHYTQITNDIQASNIRRTLWFNMVDIDVRTTVLAGTFSTINETTNTNVGPLLMTSMDVLHKAQREEYIKSEKLNVLFYEISRLVNNVQQKTSLNKLRRLLKELKEYVQTDYNMNDLKNASNLHNDSRHYFSITYENVKILTKNVLLTTLELQIYFLLCEVFESNKSLNVELYKEFFLKGLETHRKIYDISSAYFQGKFAKFVSPAYNFEIYPLLNSALSRIFVNNTSSILRGYHAQELLQCGACSNPKMTIESMNSFIETKFKLSQSFLQAYKDKITKNYFVGMKSLAYFKFGLVSLSTYKFETMARIIRYLESSEKENFEHSIKFPTKKREQFRNDSRKSRSLIDADGEWIQFNNRNNGESGTVININSSNLYTHFSPEFINEAIETLSGNFIYDDELNERLAHLPAEPLITRNHKMRDFMNRSDQMADSSQNRDAKSQLNYDINDALLDNYLMDAEFFQEIFSGFPEVAMTDNISNDIFSMSFD